MVDEPRRAAGESRYRDRVITSGFTGPSSDDFSPIGVDVLQFALTAVGIAAVTGLVALWVATIVSISRRTALMTGLESLGWYAFVVIAQVIGPLVWFLYARDRYARLDAPRSARPHDIR